MKETERQLTCQMSLTVQHQVSLSLTEFLYPKYLLTLRSHAHTIYCFMSFLAFVLALKWGSLCHLW
jgi:hypothetical protein